MLPALSTKPKQGVRQVQGLSNDSIDSYSNMPAGGAVATYADNTTARSNNGGNTARNKKPQATHDDDGAVLARVVRDRKASGDEELTLKTGDVVKVLSNKRTGYLKCEFNDEEGYVPSSYLEFFDEQGDTNGGDHETQDTARTKKKKKAKKHKEKEVLSDNEEPRSPRKAHGERDAVPVDEDAGGGADGVDSPRKKKKKSKKSKKNRDDEEDDEKPVATDRTAKGDETERKKSKKKKKHRHESSESSESDDSSARRRRRRHRRRRGHDSDSDSSSSTGSSDSSGARRRRRRRRRHSSSNDSDSDDNDKRRSRRRHRHRSSGSENEEGGKSSRRDRHKHRDDDAKTARSGKSDALATDRSEKATAREEKTTAASGSATSGTAAASSSTTTTTTTARDNKAQSQGMARGKDDESRAESNASKNSKANDKNGGGGGGLGNKIGEKMRSLLGGGKKTERGTKSSGGILNACPNTVQGEEGWYEHGENERYYFVLLEGKWSLLYGPMTEDDFEIYCQKVMDQGRSVELPPTYLHKSGYFLNSEFRVYKAAS